MKQSIAYCIRTIAYQLAITHHDFAGKLIQLHRDTGFMAVHQKFDVIWDMIFENILFRMDLGQTLHWALDGLDEADVPKVLVHDLMHIKSRTPIKVLLLSRPMNDLTNLMTSKFGTFPLVHISVEDSREDIEAYIASMASEIFFNNEPVHQYVTEQIRTRAEGSFLWARLALDALRDSWHTQADIDVALNDVPAGMSSLYERMMDNVRKQSPRLQEIAVQILTWASCAIRPLTISELTAALQPESDGFVSLPETVAQICGQFVRLDNGRILLIHSTARAFLLDPSNEVPAALGQQTGHDQLAITCLQYLSQDHWRQNLSSLSEERAAGTSLDRLKPLYEAFPLLEYSTNYWAYHVSHASTGNRSLLSSLRIYCNKYILQWIHAVALSNHLENLPSAARSLTTWIRRRREQAQLGDMSRIGSEVSSLATEAAFVEDWTTDLIRIVSKFGSNLVQSPSSIYRNITPMCPKGSITSRTYGQDGKSLLSVKGISVEYWDDNLARLSLGEDELATMVRSAGNYFLALIPRGGTIIVWHKETCEEVHRLRHREWVTLLSTNKTGRMAATAGRYTIRVWELTTGLQLYTLQKSNLGRTMSLDFAKTDFKLLVGFDDCTVSCYDLETRCEKTIFAEPSQALQQMGSCPRFMSLSPDQTKIAIAFPGRPVAVWDMVQTQLSPKPEAKLCTRMADKDLKIDGDDVFNPAEVVRWQPDGSTVYILYHDTTIVVWDLVEDVQTEHGDTNAREMALNTDGTLLLTSSNGGAVRIWGLPKFNLIYELDSDEFVRDLTFSPDSQRIYDVRGSGCNVWAPTF